MLLTWRDGRTAGPLRLDVAMAATFGRTWEEASSIQNVLLGGGFKYYFFPPRNFGEMIQFGQYFSKSVETTN